MRKTKKTERLPDVPSESGDGDRIAASLQRSTPMPRGYLQEESEPDVLDQMLAAAHCDEEGETP